MAETKIVLTLNENFAFQILSSSQYNKQIKSHFVNQLHGILMF